MKKLSRIILLTFLLCIIPLYTPTFSAEEFPKPTSLKYVNDYVGLLTDGEKNSIVSIGYELEQKTGAQSILVVIESTKGIPIEDYSNKLFRTWGIGQKDKDNGLLIVMAMNDKKWRVEVGRGLEGAVPDALSNRVMNEIALPKFKEGNFGKGLTESYSAFSDLISKEYGVTLEKSLNIPLPQNPSSSNNSNLGLFMGGTGVVLILLDVFLNKGRVSSTLLQIMFISSFRRRGPRGGSGGGGFGGFGGGSSNGGGSSGGW